MLVKHSITALMCAVTLLFATSADASLKLRLTDSASATSVTITDEVAGAFGDFLLRTPGSILFIGTVGNFTVNVETGTSKPTTGTVTFPHLTLTSIASTAAGSVASTLTIELTDTDFGPSSDPLSFLTTSNSGNPGTQTVTLSSYVDTSNAEFGTGTLLSSLGPNSGLFDVSGVDSASTTPSPYSVTLVATVSHGAGAGTSNFDSAVVAIPEPGTIAVWSLLGIVGLFASYRTSWRR